MSKHYRTAGLNYKKATIGGKEYKFTPLKVGHYAEMEAYVVEQRGDPIEAAAEAIQNKNIPPQFHSSIWDSALKTAANNRTVTSPEMSDFENSTRGFAFKVWKCMETHQPEIDSVDAALKWITDLGEDHYEEIMAHIHVASGEGELKNSSGREPTTEKTDPAGQ